MRLRFLVPALAAVALSCSDSTVPEVGEVLSVAAGDGFTCALVGESVHCWGRNDLGQLGRGAVIEDAGPGPVLSEERFKLLAAGDRNACAVTTGNKVLCWGQGRIFGGTAPVTTPTVMTGTFPASITSIGVGYAHGCVLASGGVATCFGTNANGEVGNGTTDPVTVARGATPVTGGRSFSQLSVGAFHTCGVESGDVWCWGLNFAASFGPGKSAPSYPAPTQVTLAFDAARVEAGSGATCALDVAVTAWCWGVNVAAQLGRGAGSASPSSADPAQVSQTPYATIALPKINRTVSHTCGISPGGVVLCWGLADSSQLGRTGAETCTSGTSSFGCSGTPAAIESTLTFKQLALGRDHTCALTSEPVEVYCWGGNSRRQRGGVPSGPTTTPGRVTIVVQPE
jgi:alpha-tubulin suppressor-like RCC1 family protein